MATNNTFTIRADFKDGHHGYELGLRPDIMLSDDLVRIESYLNEAASVAIQGLLTEVRNNDYRKFCVEVKAKERHHKGHILVGSVIIGPPRAQGAHSRLQILTGKKIFYRCQQTAHNFLHHNSKTIGCDNAAWKVARDTYKVEYMVTYAMQENELYVVHTKNVDIVDSYGQGMQARARLNKVILLTGEDGIGPYSFEPPKAHKVERVESEY